MNKRGLRNYFGAFGGLDGSHLERCDDDENATGDLKVETDKSFGTPAWSLCGRASPGRLLMKWPYLSIHSGSLDACSQSRSTQSLTVASLTSKSMQSSAASEKRCVRATNAGVVVDKNEIFERIHFNRVGTPTNHRPQAMATHL
jgi:hypothetical protein